MQSETPPTTKVASSIITQEVIMQAELYDGTKHILSQRIKNGDELSIDDLADKVILSEVSENKH